MILEYFLIGLIVGFIYYELVGVSPGGVIAPAYFAIFILQPNKILVTIVLAFVVLWIMKMLSKRLIVYGKRKLLLALLLSFVLKLLVENGLQPLSVVQIDLQSIGYIIPGLIANEMMRQKVMPTLFSITIVTVIVYLIIIII